MPTGAGPRTASRVGFGLGVPSGVLNGLFVGEDVGNLVALGVEVGVLGAAVGVDPAEVLGRVGLDVLPEEGDFFGVAVETGVGPGSCDVEPGQEVGRAVEVAAVVDPDPGAGELRVVEFGEHVGFPAVEVVEGGAEVSFVPGEDSRDAVGAVVLVTPGIGTCGIGRPLRSDVMWQAMVLAGNMMTLLLPPAWRNRPTTLRYLRAAVSPHR